MEIKIKVDEKELIETLLSYYKHDDIELSDSQNEILDNINEKRLLIRKDRQTGSTTIINAMIACKLVSTEKISINVFTHHNDSAKYHYDNIHTFLSILIDALGLEVTFKKFNNFNHSILLSNGNYINFITNAVSMRGNIEDGSWCIFDEIAFNKQAPEIYSLLKNTNKSLKITIIGGQYGIDKFIFPIYMLKGKTNFNIIDVRAKNAKFFKNLDDLKKHLPSINYDENFEGKFIVNNPGDIDAEEMINNMNSFITNGKKLSLLELTEILKKLNYVTDYK